MGLVHNRGRGGLFNRGTNKVISSWSPPNKSDILAGGDGTIILVGSDYYLKDLKSGKNLLITGYDFDSTWTKGIPYKSAATISAPAGDTAFIAADLNNYWYAVGGTPNQIPVVSLFQDVDYEHKTFFKHAAQVLDGNGVETYEPRVIEWAVYNTALTGANLTSANTYYGVPAEITTNVIWVSKAGNDTTGNGTKALPYLTPQKANDFVNNKTIYIKTGLYVATHGNGYFWWSNNWTMRSIGGVELRGAAGNARVYYNVSGNHTHYNTVFNNNNVESSTPMTCYGANAARVTNLYSCLVKGGTLNINSTNAAIETINLYNSVLIGCSKTTSVGGVNYINTCYYKEHYDSQKALSAVINSRIKNYGMIVENPFISAIGNKVSNNFVFLQGGTITSTHSVSIHHNVCTMTQRSASYVSLFYFNRTSSYYWDIEFYNNTITNTGTLSGNYMFNAASDKLHIYNNHFINRTIAEIVLTSMSSVGLDGSGIDVHNNYFINGGANSGICFIGGESNILSNVGAKFYNNRVIGHFFVDPAGIGTQHALLFTSGGNMIIKHNYISHATLGLVVKCGDGAAYTSGGIWGNIIEDCVKHLWCRGVGGINISNNTLKHSGYAYGQFFVTAFMADENSAAAGTQESANVIGKNNIIEISLNANINANNIASFDAYAAAHGCDVLHSIVHNGTYKVQDGATAYATLALAQAAGFMADCIDSDPLLTDFIPQVGSPAIGSGETLDATYEDMLDASTTWGSDTELPVVVTKQQGAAWDIGAYIH